MYLINAPKIKLIQSFSGQKIALNRMAFDELSIVAATNPRLNSVAREEFRRRFNDYEIVILNATDVPEGAEKYHTHRNDKLIEIYDYRLAVNVLNNFGNEVQRLEIAAHDMQGDRLDEIIRVANEFVSASMNHSKFVVNERGTLKRSTIPFKEVGDNA